MAISPTEFESTLIVPTDDLARHLRLDFPVSDDDTTLLTAYSGAAQKYAEKLRGESFSSHQFILSLSRPVTIEDSVFDQVRQLNSFADDVIAFVRLPIGPVLSVDSVQFYDSNNTLQTMSTSAYRVVLGKPATVVFNNNLPTLFNREDAIKITFSSGYSAGNPLPQTVTIAVRLLAAEWYRTREYLSEGKWVETPIGGVPAVDRLLMVR